jgi:uncharacterized protein
MSPFVTPIVLLIASNVFVRLVRAPEIPRERPVDRGAGELGHRVLRVLARRAGEPLGAAVYAPAQLKAIQEVITLVVFAAFSALYLGHPLGPSQYIGFGFIALGAFFVFR